ncbi:hypothetical protein [Nocardioides acrostichi]|uniref:DUF4406 domain-containing protein n=1 Tax=Nocardioides acrostichi TaxID=2784339 RepID=A0A930Y7L3_9ACTN|nr:hypothetical protein [Nocardioides acrostichi]MBF4163550.1 hypothetical protein [Nocardioides acrostichi]
MGIPVVALCGSMRFRDEFDRLTTELTLAGNVVLAPVMIDASTVLDEETRARLGRVHLAKVAMADEALVVNVGGYLGESTRREIEHAHAHGVAVRYLEPPLIEPGEAVVEPGEAVVEPGEAVVEPGEALAESRVETQ